MVEYVRYHVTPEIADDWLKHRNTRNRPFREEHIRRYMEDMKAGRWVENGDAIRFDADGTLLDGQNRLEACRRAGVGFDTCLVLGLPPEAQATMDQGARRSGADVLRLGGVDFENPTLLASVAAADIRRERDGLAAAFRRNGRGKPSAGELLEHVRATPRLGEAARRGAAVAARTAGLLSPTAAAVVWLALDDVDPEAAGRFMESLATGADLRDGDAILTLRAALARLSRDKRPQLERAAYTFKAWNRWRRGGRCLRLGWAPDGEKREPFPTPR
ncbi:hypothetical protein [Bifidobacterium myosotis]|uniref:ParB/Sulfiredoxin domain-containing protein n=1 Tax=Bifidobacterium myosotis TaxID=1630166 RepID=A0A5M9ZGH9_9BIFI|nr:hypothetical protein [Bifidobacterium myosotis]KAA8825373.1 hypothetical protein EMO91_12475 [Bifidobacterium myosotis]